MGFFIILNLLIAFVSEKRRDIITILINGYSYKNANRYIYIDTIFLTIIGLIIGVGAGILFANLTISAFESGYIHLIHTPNLFGILIGIGFTVTLVTVMSLISLKQIRKFNLSDINGSLM